LAILAALVFEISQGKKDTQTKRGKNLTPTTAIIMGNYVEQQKIWQKDAQHWKQPINGFITNLQTQKTATVVIIARWKRSHTEIFREGTCACWHPWCGHSC